MSIYDKQKEIINLVGQIKENLFLKHPDQTVSTAEVEAFQKELTTLSDKAAVLKYLIEEAPSFEETLEKETSKEEPVIEQAIIEKTADLKEEADHSPYQEEEKEETDKEEEINGSVNQLNEEEEDKEEEEESEDQSATIDEEEEKEEHQSQLEEDILDVLEGMGEKEEIPNVQDINEALSKDGASLGERLERQPIANLLTAIGLNERYHYANELFDGDMEEFKKIVQLLNDFDNITEARYFFDQNLREEYEWDEENELVKAFYQLVERRYLKS